MIVPTPARFDVRLEPRELPGLTISLPPDWPAEEEAPPTFEYGSVKLLQPGRGGHFVSVRWTVSEPVQAEEYLRIVTAGGLAPRERSTVTVGGHEATSFYLESSDNRSLRAAATIWNCPDDRRVLWVFSNLAGSKSELLATHERIAQSARCHTGGARSAAQRVFPDFVPPSGFRRATTPGGGQLLFVGPRGEQIVFESAVAGRSELTRADVPPEAMGAMMRGLGLSTIVAAPTLRTAKDLSGHERRIWSAAGTSSRGTPLQVELMVWYCDARNMTFVGGYAAPDRHDPRDGVEALLPAACH